MKQPSTTGFPNRIFPSRRSIHRKLLFGKPPLVDGCRFQFQSLIPPAPKVGKTIYLLGFWTWDKAGSYSQQVLSEPDPNEILMDLEHDMGGLTGASLSPWFSRNSCETKVLGRRFVSHLKTCFGNLRSVWIPTNHPGSPKRGSISAKDFPLEYPLLGWF